jgi:PEP-CTERM motif
LRKIIGRVGDGGNQTLNQIIGDKSMNKRILLIIAVLASAGLSARAQNLVTNPGFETGNFSGWMQFGDTSFTDIQTFDVHSGTYAAEFGPATSDGGIAQEIATIPGQLYTLSFWLDNRDTSGNNHMSVFFGGVTFLSLTNAPSFPYTQYSFTLMATATPSLLQFSFYNPPSWFDLDDVSVTVPEPGTLGLIALGALGIVGAVCKRPLV